MQRWLERRLQKAKPGDCIEFICGGPGPDLDWGIVLEVKGKRVKYHSPSLDFVAWGTLRNGPGYGGGCWLVPRDIAEQRSRVLYANETPVRTENVFERHARIWKGEEVDNG